MEYITPIKGQHVFVIGIDFGHGETSADICNIQWDDKYLELDTPKSIEIFNGVNAIKSILLIEQKDGVETHYIGQQAISRFSNKNKQSSATYSYYSYFKKVPSMMSPEDRKAMCTFMGEVYRQIRLQRAELTDNNHVVYIACPSNSEKWNEKEQSEYAKIALEAGLPLAQIKGQSIGIIRESRAAFLKARYDPNSKTSIKEGILLIDFGSSTVDLTYYSSKHTDKPIDDGGAECGASNVEIAITKDLRNKEPKVDDAIQKDDSAETAVLLSVREAKEKFYTYEGEDMEINLSLTKITGGRTMGAIEKYYSTDEIETILAKYLVEVRKCFEKYRDTYLKGMPIKLIFMTGGASRMQFVQDIAREVFNYSGTFYRETNPSLTISNGIALAGRADLRSAALLEKLLNDNHVRNGSIASKVIEKSIDTITSDVMDTVSARYGGFASSSNDENIASLERNIMSDVKYLQYSSTLSSKFSSVLRDEVNESILSKLNDIVGDYFPDGSIEKISSSRNFSVNLNVNGDAIAKVVSDSVDSISEGLFEGLLKFGATIVGTAVSVAAGGLAKLIGEIHDGFVEEKDKWHVDFGDTVDEISEELIPDWRDRDTKLSKGYRQTVLRKFNENKSSYESGIKDAIKKSLDENKSLKSDIDMAFREETSAYIIEQVSRVRLMLNE